MSKDSVVVSVEIGRNTDMDEVFTNLSLVKKLISDIDRGLDIKDLTDLLAHNGLSSDKSVEQTDTSG